MESRGKTSRGGIRGHCKFPNRAIVFANARCRKVLASSSQLWRVVFQHTALLTFPLTVAVHRIKKPFIYAGSINLNTDGQVCGLTR